ncbi:class I SAM-dependent methyltransferase [candidate division KSB1 bacterium]|nr:class I SAM-dependent methyltransferase [candidate division KSB1 bacterium]
MTRKTPEQLARTVFGKRAAKYTISACHTDPFVLSDVIQFCAPEPQWSAVDVATGTGHTAFALAPQVARVYALDITPEMISEAQKLQAQNGIANVTFLMADAHRLPFATESVDLVTCRRSAHHFSDIFKALGEMKRILRSEGRLVIDDRSVPEDDFIDDCMNRLDRLHDTSHVRQYRPGEWKKMLEHEGFRIDKIAPYVKHRPLTSLTDGVSPTKQRAIHRILRRLNDSQRFALNLIEIDGQAWINHWYVMIACRGCESKLPHSSN